jgi:hypothetical protein
MESSTQEYVMHQPKSQTDTSTGISEFHVTTVSICVLLVGL